MMMRHDVCFFFNDTATTEIYTLSLHDALPISVPAHPKQLCDAACVLPVGLDRHRRERRLHVPGLQQHDLVDRKSTRLNSSHANISYAVFCLKKKSYHTAYPHVNSRYYAPLRFC